MFHTRNPLTAGALSALLLLSAPGAEEARSSGAGSPAAKDSVIGLEKSLISGRRTGKASNAAKMPLARIENPQVYNTVDSKTMDEQVVTRYEEALRNVPGLDKLWESTGRASGDGAAYYTMRG